VRERASALSLPTPCVPLSPPRTFAAACRVLWLPPWRAPSLGLAQSVPSHSGPRAERSAFFVLFFYLFSSPPASKIVSSPWCGRAVAPSLRPVGIISRRPPARSVLLLPLCFFFKIQGPPSRPNFLASKKTLARPLGGHTPRARKCEGWRPSPLFPILFPRHPLTTARCLCIWCAFLPVRVRMCHFPVDVVSPAPPCDKKKTRPVLSPSSSLFCFNSSLPTFLSHSLSLANARHRRPRPGRPHLCPGPVGRADRPAGPGGGGPRFVWWKRERKKKRVRQFQPHRSRGGCLPPSAPPLHLSLISHTTPPTQAAPWET